MTNPVPGFSAVLRRLALTVNPEKYADQKDGYETDFLLLVLSDGFALRDKWATGYFVNEVNVVVSGVVCGVVSVVVVGSMGVVNVVCGVCVQCVKLEYSAW